MISNEELLKLQNGSDVRGIAVEGVAGEKVNLLPEAVNRIAAGFVTFLEDRLGKSADQLRIAVGHDSRISAGMLKDALFQALTAMGVTVYDCGMASTPAMFMSIVFPQTKMDGSIMITASHLPYNRNGLKFFTEKGGLEKAEITDVLTRASSEPVRSGDLVKVQPLDIISLYTAHLRGLIGKALDTAGGQPGSGAARGRYDRQPVSRTGRPFPEPYPQSGKCRSHGQYPSGCPEQ